MRIIVATATIGLVIEAMRKIVSVFMAALASLSRKPNASCITILPLRAISTTAPGSSPALTPSLMRSDRRFRRVVEKPTSSGDCALGSPCAPADAAIDSANTAQPMVRKNVMLPPLFLSRATPSENRQTGRQAPAK